MALDFGALIVDLETLASSSQEDFNIEFWNSYEQYINKYNKLLQDIQSLGFFKKTKPIKHLSFSDQSFSNTKASNEEKAKLREVTNESNSLLKKVKLLLAPPKTINKDNIQVRSNKIFLVHGQDTEMTRDITQTFEKLELETITVNGQTITKKTKDQEHVSFAVVLVSPDELAYPKNETADQAKYRANQNVIFELGYLLGKLGTENVIAIYKKQKDFEIPDNYKQILWIEYKNEWYFKLIKELNAKNFQVDANKLGWL